MSDDRALAPGWWVGRVADAEETIMESRRSIQAERSECWRRRILCATVGLALLQMSAASASGQNLRSSRPSAGSGTLFSLSAGQRVGNTRVSNNTTRARMGGYSPSALGLSSGGFLGQSSRRPSRSGRSRRSSAFSSRGLLGSSAGRSGNTRLTFARPFERASFLLTPPIGPRQVESTTERLLKRASYSSSFGLSSDLRQAKLQSAGASRLDALVLASDLLVRSTAYTVPVVRSLQLTGQMGTPYSSRAPEGLSFEFPDTAETAGPAILQSTIQAERLASTHRNRIAEGWDWLRQQSLHQAKAAFASAEASDRHDPASRTGQTVIHLLLGNRRTAGRMLEKTLRHDRVSAFTVDVDLTEALGEGQRWRDLDVVTEAHLIGAPDDPEKIAIRAYVLWYGGDRQEAMRVVRRIQGADPMSEFSGMESLMQRALKGAEASLPQSVN